jgi:ribosomal protein S4
VTKADLNECDTPQEMERLVKRAEAASKREQAKQVTTNGKVAVSGGLTTRPNWLKMDTREMLEKYL